MYIVVNLNIMKLMSEETPTITSEINKPQEPPLTIETNKEQQLIDKLALLDQETKNQIELEKQLLQNLHSPATSHLLLSQLEQQLSRGETPYFDRDQFWDALNEQTDIVEYLYQIEPELGSDPNFLFQDEHSSGTWTSGTKLRNLNTKTTTDLQTKKETQEGGNIRLFTRRVAISSDQPSDIWQWYNSRDKADQIKYSTSLSTKIHEYTHSFWANYFITAKDGVRSRTQMSIIPNAGIDSELKLIMEGFAYLSEQITMFTNINEIESTKDLVDIFNFYNSKYIHPAQFAPEHMEEVALDLYVGMALGEKHPTILSNEILHNLNESRPIGDRVGQKNRELTEFTPQHYLQALKKALYGNKDFKISEENKSRAGFLAAEGIRHKSELRAMQLKRVMAEQIIIQNTAGQSEFFWLENEQAFDTETCAAITIGTDSFVKVGIHNNMLEFEMQRKETPYVFDSSSRPRFRRTDTPIPKASDFYRSDSEITDEESTEIVTKLFNSQLLQIIDGGIFFMGHTKITNAKSQDLTEPTVKLYSKEDVQESPVWGDLRDINSYINSAHMLRISEQITNYQTQ